MAKNTSGIQVGDAKSDPEMRAQRIKEKYVSSKPTAAKKRRGKNTYRSVKKG